MDEELPGVTVFLINFINPDRTGVLYGKVAGIMSFEAVLTIITGVVFYVTVLELLWLLNIRLNAGWLLAIGIFIDFLAFLLERIIHGYSSLALTLLFPAGFLVMMTVHFPYCLKTLRNKQLFLYLAFIAYTSLTLLWSGNVTQGWHELLFLLLHGVIPAIYILAIFALNKKFSWNQTLTLSLLYCAMLIWGSRVSVINPGESVFAAQNPIWDIRMALIAGILTIWLPGVPLVIKIPAAIICGIAALTTESRGPMVAFFSSLVIVWSINVRPEKLRIKSMFLFFSILLTIVSVVFLSFIWGDASTHNIALANRGVSSLSYPERIADDTNRQDRLSRDMEAFNIFKAHPLTGSGLGGFAPAMKEYAHSQAPHNILLEILSELGVIGFSIWSLFILVTTQKLKNAPVPLSIFLFSLFSSLFSGDLGSNYEYVLIGLITPIFIATEDEPGYRFTPLKSLQMAFQRNQ